MTQNAPILTAEKHGGCWHLHVNNNYSSMAIPTDIVAMHVFEETGWNGKTHTDTGKIIHDNNH